jgi:hypothetical protein
MTKSLYCLLFTEYYSSYLIKKNEIGTECGTYGRQESCTWCSARRRDGKRPLGISRRGWEDKIKVYFEEVGWGGMDWISLDQDRYRWRGLVKVVMKFRVL